MAEALFAVLARRINVECRAHLKACREKDAYWDSGDSKSEGVSFRESAIRSLESRFRHLKRTIAAEQPEGNALVVTRAGKVSDWVNERFTFKATTLDKRAEDPSAHSGAGWRAGQKMDVSVPRTDGVKGADQRRIG